MLKIILKDIYQGRYVLLIYFIIITAFMLFVSNILEGALGLTGLITIMIPLGISIKNEVYEQKNKGYYLLKNLPIKHYKIVVSKFLTTLILGAFSIAITTLLTFILSDKINVNNIGSTLGAVLVSCIVVGIFYMISYKFGAEKANTFIIISLSVLMLIGQIAFLFARTSISRDIILNIESFFVNTNGYFLLLIGLIIYLLTMIMSIRLFKNSKVL